MGKKKLEPKRIQNPSSRRATFYKRKSGLLKKAFELSVFCDVEVALIIFSETGRIYEFASQNESVTTLLAKYRSCIETTRNSSPTSLQNTEFHPFQLKMLSEKIEILQKREQIIMASEDLEPLTLKELQRLEKQLRRGIKKIYDRKIQILSQSSKLIVEKVRSLEAENVELRSKMSSRGDSSTSAPELFMHASLPKTHLQFRLPYNAMSSGPCDGNRDGDSFSGEP